METTSNSTSQQSWQTGRQATPEVANAAPTVDLTSEVVSVASSRPQGPVSVASSEAHAQETDSELDEEIARARLEVVEARRLEAEARLQVLETRRSSSRASRASGRSSTMNTLPEPHPLPDLVEPNEDQ